jgi:DDE superfamily endonuclease
LIEDAYRLGESMGLAVWCTDQAGPFQTVPYPGQSWRPEGEPARQPHEYLRDGTAKILTLFDPADGQVRIEGVTTCPNPILHGWLKRELTAVLAAMPTPAATKATSPGQTRKDWERWQEGLTVRPTLLDELPPLRMLLVLDNLAGHKTPEFVCRLFERGIMPLYTPVGGSWLNMAESIQRALKRRAPDGQHPTTVAEILAWFEAVARHWNAAPTRFAWGGKRAARRQRQRERRHRLGGSGACALAPLRSDPVRIMATGKPNDPLEVNRGIRPTTANASTGIVHEYHRESGRLEKVPPFVETQLWESVRLGMFRHVREGRNDEPDRRVRRSRGARGVREKSSRR